MATPFPSGREHDRTLCGLFAHGNVEAGHLLTERYMPLVRSRAHAFRASGVEADDLVQEGLLGLLYAIRAYDPSYNTSFATFAFTCVTNRMISTVRSVGRNPARLSLQDHSSACPEGLSGSLWDDPQEILDGREQVERWMVRAQSLLSAFEFNALRLYLSGYAYVEMAASLQATTKAVDNALQRARRKLRAP